MAKYKDIADEIRAKIRNEDYTFGQKLPYEYILCMTYHCNRETMKKALDILVKEGLIIRRRGAGTFVKDFDPDETPINLLNRSLTYRFAKEKEVSSQVLVFEVVPSDEHLAKKLQIEEGDFVYHIIRNRSVGHEPWLVDITYIPLSLIPNLKLETLKNSLYEYVSSQLHLKIQSCHLNITSGMSTQLEQEFLGLKEGEPFVQEEQVSYLSNGAIFEYTISRYHYAKYEFSTIIVNQ